MAKDFIPVFLHKPLKLFALGFFIHVLAILVMPFTFAFIGMIGLLGMELLELSAIVIGALAVGDMTIRIWRSQTKHNTQDSNKVLMFILCTGFFIWGIFLIFFVYYVLFSLALYTILKFFGIDTLKIH